MLKEIEIEGYRVFKTKSTLPFQKGLTCLAGKNNTGKTTALSILSIIRDSALIPNRNQFSLNPQSADPVPLDKESFVAGQAMAVSLTFDLNSKEFLIWREFVSKYSNEQAYSGKPIRDAINGDSIKLRYDFILDERFSAPRADDRKLILSRVSINGIEYIGLGMWKSSFKFGWVGDSNSFGVQSYDDPERPQQLTLGKEPLAFPYNYLLGFLKNLQIVSANRNIPDTLNQQRASSIIGPNSTEVTRILSGWRDNEKAKFTRVVTFLNQVDDSIGDIRFPEDGHNGEKIVKFAKTTNDNAPFSTLKNSGTGISQLLALATHLLNPTSNTLFVIDEPQAFLHPQAEVALLNLIDESGHQVLVGSHSPIFINAAREGLIILKKTAGESKVVQTIGDATSPESLVSLATELGMPINHLLAGFGIIWLEGATEEQIVRSLRLSDRTFDLELTNINVTHLPNTGDANGAKARRITNSISDVLEKQIGVKSRFILDQESRKPEEIEKLKIDFKGRISFLKQLELEYYLMNPTAIAKLLSELYNEFGMDSNPDIKRELLTAEVVAGRIEASKRKTPSDVLEEVFEELIRATYRKPEHGFRLASICIELNSKCLDDFKNLVSTAAKELAS